MLILAKPTHICTTNSSSSGIPLQETQDGISSQAASSNHGSGWCHSEEGTKSSNIQTKQRAVEKVTRTWDPYGFGRHPASQLEESYD
jgi:hypothetical protein